MRVAVFSDIHGNYQALTKIIESIKNNNIDKIICLGDTIGLGPCSNECLELINKNNIIQIAGNHELYYTRGVDRGHVINKEALEHNDYIHKHLKGNVDDSRLFYKIKRNNKTLYFMHYFLRNNKYPFESSSIFKSDEYKNVYDRFNYDYVFYGHRHLERIEEYNNHIYYGIDSSGCTTKDETCYYVINIKKEIEIEKVVLKYDRKKFESEIKRAKYPNKEHIAEYFFGIKNC